jgi:hypothetical protein
MAAKRFLLLVSSLEGLAGCRRLSASSRNLRACQLVGLPVCFLAVLVAVRDSLATATLQKLDVLVRAEFAAASF